MACGGSPREGDIDVHLGLGSVSDGAKPDNQSSSEWRGVPDTLGSFLRSVPGLPPSPAPRELLVLWRQKGAARHAEPEAMFSRIRMNPFPCSALCPVQQVPEYPSLWKPRGRTPALLVLEDCHCSLGNSPSGLY